MPYSQNGYPANDRNLVSSRLVPGTTRRLTVRNGPAGDLLLALAGEFDRTVENIDAPQEVMDDWGYAERPIRGGTTLSNHASGTAIDLNATQHPLGTNPADNFTPAQIAAIRRALIRAQGCVRWGGDYTGRKDPMHFEIIKGETACRAALANFRTEEQDMNTEQDKRLKFLERMGIETQRRVTLGRAEQAAQAAALSKAIAADKGIDPAQLQAMMNTAAQQAMADSMDEFRGMLEGVVREVVPAEQADQILAQMGEKLAAGQ